MPDAQVLELSPTEAGLRLLADRDQIRNILALHSRGVDRADATMLGAAYHDDATVHYGFFVGTAADLVAFLARAQKSAKPSLHRTANIDIRVAGDRAASESYVIARVGDGDQERIVLGRYLDRFSRRDGQWRLDHRYYVMDGNTNEAAAPEAGDPPSGHDHFAPVGAKGAADAARVLMTQHRAAATHLQEAPPMTHSAADIDAALSRDAIRSLLTGYCRGADRADADMLAAQFWPDAAVVSGAFNGKAPDFARTVAEQIRNYLDSCFHSIANEWIEVKGDHAIGEHYVIAHTRGAGTDTLVGGRYVDSYERRDGIWKIAARTFVQDWSNNRPSTYESEGFYAGLTTRGCYGAQDPIYAHWASL
ncbi:nuclear transport factor 2 family protein [Novosphingobium umbonatum]|uniref:Nuclear transport factor 2 family protein n=1 Tax=Novosphingobium umbonatum TaxID=1908524 RepID=A0A437N6Y9_9SPHN|nr:nuclear transport factor 2 family protein [Novosphingobium umbonatum]RVU05699.1 nuclear transport factor 2 family protein [Novosphingobium umbonatum]